MKFMIAAIAVALASGTAVAQSSYRTDQYGNSYQTHRSGNISQTYGSNASTGSTWSSTTQNVGNSSYTTGTNSNGQGWSSTTHNYGGGNSTTYSTDSRGNTTTRSCFGGICN